MIRLLVASLMLCASIGAAACQLCLGVYRSSQADQLVALSNAVLVLPSERGYRVLGVVKGRRPPSGRIKSSDVQLKFAPSGSGEPLLLVRDPAWPMWVSVGEIDVEHLRWLRVIAAGKRSSAMNVDEWRDRVALMVPYLEHREPLVAEFAYGELAAAPYAALLAVKSRIAAPSLRKWLADPALAAREPLYLLLLGIAGDATDAARLESRLDTAWQGGDATNLGACLAADLQLRGPARVAWLDQHYLRDRKRTTPEIEAALLALGAHGDANDAVPRARVIESYRAFIKEHKDIAGFVASELAAWQYWEVVPEYVAIMKSDARQQYPSRLAIVMYLRQSPNAATLDIALAETASPLRPGAITLSPQ